MTSLGIAAFLLFHLGDIQQRRVPQMNPPIRWTRNRVMQTVVGKHMTVPAQDGGIEDIQVMPSIGVQHVLGVIVEAFKQVPIVGMARSRRTPLRVVGKGSDFDGWIGGLPPNGPGPVAAIGVPGWSVAEKENVFIATKRLDPSLNH